MFKPSSARLSLVASALAFVISASPTAIVATAGE